MKLEVATIAAPSEPPSGPGPWPFPWGPFLTTRVWAVTASVPLRATRRGALVGTLMALTATGCDAITRDDASPTGPVSPSRSGTLEDPGSDPDEALVEGLRADLAAASVLVSSVLRARPGLAAELAGFGTLHTRHLRALEGPRPRGRAPVRGNAAAVRKTVRARETRLQASLATAAVAAESGQLAALLASMSAAVAQQLTLTGAGQ